MYPTVMFLYDTTYTGSNIYSVNQVSELNQINVNNVGFNNISLSLDVNKDTVQGRNYSLRITNLYPNNYYFTYRYTVDDSTNWYGSSKWWTIRDIIVEASGDSTEYYGYPSFWRKDKFTYGISYVYKNGAYNELWWTIVNDTTSLNIGDVNTNYIIDMGVNNEFTYSKIIYDGTTYYCVCYDNTDISIYKSLDDNYWVLYSQITCNSGFKNSCNLDVIYYKDKFWGLFPTNENKIAVYLLDNDNTVYSLVGNFYYSYFTDIKNLSALSISDNYVYLAVNNNDSTTYIYTTSNLLAFNLEKTIVDVGKGELAKLEDNTIVYLYTSKYTDSIAYISYIYKDYIKNEYTSWLPTTTTRFFNIKQSTSAFFSDLTVMGINGGLELVCNVGNKSSYKKDLVYIKSGGFSNLNLLSNYTDGYLPSFNLPTLNPDWTCSIVSSTVNISNNKLLLKVQNKAVFTKNYANYRETNYETTLSGVKYLVKLDKIYLDSTSYFFVDLFLNQGSYTGGGYRYRGDYSRLKIDATAIYFGNKNNFATAGKHDYNLNNPLHILVYCKSGYLDNLVPYIDTTSKWGVYIKTQDNGYVSNWQEILEVSVDQTLWDTGSSSIPTYWSYGVIGSDATIALYYLISSLNNTLPIGYEQPEIKYLYSDWNKNYYKINTLINLNDIVSSGNYTVINKGIAIKFDGFTGRPYSGWDWTINSSFDVTNVFDKLTNRYYKSFTDETSVDIVLDLSVNNADYDVNTIIMQGCNFQTCYFYAQNSSLEDWSSPDLTIPIDMTLYAGNIDFVGGNYIVDTTANLVPYEYNNYYLKVVNDVLSFRQSFTNTDGISDNGIYPDSTTIGLPVIGKYGGGMKFIAIDADQQVIDRPLSIKYYGQAALQGITIDNGGSISSISFKLRRTFNNPLEMYKEQEPVYVRGVICPDNSGYPLIADVVISDNEITPDTTWGIFNIDFKENYKELYRGEHYYVGLYYATDSYYDEYENSEDLLNLTDLWESITETPKSLSGIAKPLVSTDATKIILGVNFKVTSENYGRPYVLISTDYDMTAWEYYPITIDSTTVDVTYDNFGMCRGKDGVLYVCYLEQKSGFYYYHIYTSFDDGTTWSYLSRDNIGYLTTYTYDFIYNTGENIYEIYCKRVISDSIFYYYTSDFINWVANGIYSSSKIKGFKVYYDDIKNKMYGVLVEYVYDEMDPELLLEIRTNFYVRNNLGENFTYIGDYVSEDGTISGVLGLWMDDGKLVTYLVKNQDTVIKVVATDQDNTSFNLDSTVYVASYPITTGFWAREDFDYSLDAYALGLNTGGKPIIQLTNKHGGNEHRYYQMAIADSDCYGRVDYDNFYYSEDIYNYTRYINKDLWFVTTIDGMGLVYDNTNIVNETGTIMMWVRPTGDMLYNDSTQGYMFMYVYDFDTESGLFLGKVGRALGDNGIAFGIFNSNGIIAVGKKGSDLLQTNMWSHLAATWDVTTGNIEFYLNGVKCEDTWSLYSYNGVWTKPSKVNFGATRDYSETLVSILAPRYTSCEATLDEIIIYNEILDENSIIAFYNSGARTEDIVSNVTTKIVKNTQNAIYTEDNLSGLGVMKNMSYYIYGNKYLYMLNTDVSYAYWKLHIPAQNTYEGYFKLNDLDLGVPKSLSNNYEVSYPINEDIANLRKAITTKEYTDGHVDLIKKEDLVKQWTLNFEYLDTVNRDLFVDIYNRLYGSYNNMWFLFNEDLENNINFYMVKILKELTFDIQSYDYGNFKLTLEEVKYE